MSGWLCKICSRRKQIVYIIRGVEARLNVEVTGSQIEWTNSALLNFEWVRHAHVG